MEKFGSISAEFVRLRHAARAVIFAMTVCAIAPLVEAGEVLTGPPDNPDTSAKYIFYMHGRYVENHGAWDKYEIFAIHKSLASKGLTVIGDVRSGTDPGAYSRTIVRQVRGLLRSGVPARNITIAGHSKGGLITMLVASQLQKSSIKFGILAGCGVKGSEFRRPFEKFIARGARKMRGRFLVAWDADDDIAGECDLAMRKAQVRYSNLVFHTGKGHELFYRPQAAWIVPLAEFARSD